MTTLKIQIDRKTVTHITANSKTLTMATRVDSVRNVFQKTQKGKSYK